MSEIKDGGPAFPVMWEFAKNETGMSLRDYFAGQALPGCMAKCVPMECLAGETIAQMFARKAFEVADAMIAERERSK